MVLTAARLKSMAEVVAVTLADPALFAYRHLMQKDER